MPCYSPLTAYKCASGDVVFVERKPNDIVSTLSLPCGQCIGCRLERSRQWAVRCMHEASLHESNAFVTLTYADEYLPERGKLDYPAFQRFMKRLRKRTPGGVRFYMCGEYGPLNWRPHYHACLFGRSFEDQKFLKTLPSGFQIYSSAELSELWPFGHSSVGAVTFESAGYVARYCVQKVTGDAAKLHYRRQDGDGEYDLPPEFNRMSLKPGIGAAFLDKWQSDIYPSDEIIVNGRSVKPPKYYDRVFKRGFPDEFEEIQWKRELEGRSHWEDNTDDRLRVKRIVKEAQAEFLVRSFDE